MTPSPLEKLLAVAEIHRVKARYFRHLDARDWASLALLFTPDARLRMPLWSESKPLTEAMIAFAETMAPFESIHSATMPEIEVTTADRASALWPMTDRLYTPVDGSSDLYTLVQGFGHYHEQYRKVGSSWLISELTLIRDRKDDLGEVRKIYGTTASSSVPSSVASRSAVVSAKEPNKARSSS